MIAKVKAQKTRLSTYLVKELGAKKRKSKETESEYFELSGIKIRISDHSGHQKKGSVNIYIPFNDPNTFIIENNYVISVLKSLREVKMFLQALIFTCSQYQEIYKSDLQQELMDMSLEMDRLRNQNASYFKMVKERTEAVQSLQKQYLNKLQKEAKATFKDVSSNMVCIDGSVYSMERFSKTFLGKIRNTITSCGAAKLK